MKLREWVAAAGGGATPEVVGAVPEAAGAASSSLAGGAGSFAAGIGVTASVSVCTVAGSSRNLR